ncbi:MAG TPA: molybdenum cofactor biosynthesis protein MoaE [Mycobacteriales bacterium]|nr:molybdenum cofactor biosynthesis protein MoaE [Mycobacteriales bacterium]
MTPAQIGLAQISADPLYAAEHLAAVELPGCGACVLFTGEVRDHDHGREVVELEYVGHPTAIEVLRGVAAEVAATLDGGVVAVSHRVGVLKVGDVALVAAASAAHRAEAFDACRLLVEQAKRRLPIWKRQVFADGGQEWVNCP